MKPKKKKEFIKKHEYPGGRQALQQYFQQHLVYPDVAIKNRVEGKVLVEYVIDFDGRVSDVKVLNGIGFQCDEEAVRLIKGLVFAPQNNHGIRISSKQKMKVHFKLPKPIVKNTNLQYNYTSTVKPKEPATKRDIPKSYSYTIKINR